MKKQTFAIIPARGGSKGIIRKNLKLIHGKPLVGHAIEQALSCPLIDRVIVNSEDQEIRSVAASFGAEVMDRPQQFHNDNSIQEVDRLLIHCVESLETQGENIENIVLLYPTSPLRRVETITEAVGKVLNDGFDSVLSLYEDTTYLWELDSEVCRPLNYDPKMRGPRQKENWNQYGENKAIYVMTRELLVNTGCRLGGRIGYVLMNYLESIDVDKPEDLELCQLLYKKFKQ